MLNCHNTGKVSGKNRVGGVCGGGDDSTNCYYLDTSAETSKGGTAKTAAEFKSDYVAYLLQQALNDAAPAQLPRRFGGGVSAQTTTLCLAAMLLTRFTNL